jgi:formate dehydrogenase subunit gamma
MRGAPAHFEPWSAARASEIITAHQEREGAMLPILHDIQHAFGCVPEEAVPLIAKAMNLSRAEVHGVVTFYHDFRRTPPGRHTVQICRAEACQAMGGDAIADKAQKLLGIGFGDTSNDGRVSLEPIYCLGLCACAPAAMIDGEVVGRLTPGNIADVLNERVAS